MEAKIKVWSTVVARSDETGSLEPARSKPNLTI